MPSTTSSTDRDDADLWPSFAEELGRKGLGELQRWAEKVNAGEASQHDLQIVCDVLYACMSGLAPWDDTNVVVAVDKALRKEAENA